MALTKFKSTPLPNPPKEYDAQFFRQFLRVLELYFSRLDSNTPNFAQSYTADEFIGGSFSGTAITAESVDTNTLIAHQAAIDYQQSNGILTQALISYGHKNGRQISDDIAANNFYGGTYYGNGRNLEFPYNQFQSNVTQTATAIDVATAVTYNRDDYPDGITVVSNSRITVSVSGVYTFTFSIQLQNTVAGTESVDIWFRKNGVDLTESNSRFGLSQRKSAGIPSNLIAETGFMVPLAAADYIEIMWRPSDLGVAIKTFPAVTYSAGVTPAIPATPSVLLTAEFVSTPRPSKTLVAPLPVFGFGQIGSISVSTP